MPVVDGQGNIVGVITLTDLMRILGNIYKWKEVEKSSPDMRLSSMYEMEKQNARVKDCMAKSVIALTENETIEDAARKMFNNGVHTLPVVKDNKLIGVVGKRDLIYACF
jgi:CBS domain-containing protein